jgi:hypothetical protein
MAWIIPPFKGASRVSTRICGALWACAMLAACWCVPPAAGAHPPDAKALQAITEIALERDCNGCTTSTVLVLRRDGTATLTYTGKARLGTEDKVSRGTVQGADFDTLARLVLAQDFFALSDEYQDPALQDGGWTTIRIQRGAQDKRVFSREGAGPASLQALTAAIDTLKARIRFVP